jgi:lipid A ethanolaminephosphotransferase
VFVLALAPAIWLWRTPVRRLPPMHYLLQNWGLAAASCAVILVAMLASTPDLYALVRAQPQLRQMANPFGPLQALFDVAKLRLSPS